MNLSLFAIRFKANLIIESLKLFPLNNLLLNRMTLPLTKGRSKRQIIKSKLVGVGIIIRNLVFTHRKNDLKDIKNFKRS